MPAVLSKPLYFRSKYTGFQNEIHTDKQGKLNVHWWIKYGSVIIDPTPCAYGKPPEFAVTGERLYFPYDKADTELRWKEAERYWKNNNLHLDYLTLTGDFQPSKCYLNAQAKWRQLGQREAAASGGTRALMKTAALCCLGAVASGAAQIWSGGGGGGGGVAAAWLAATASDAGQQANAAAAVVALCPPSRWRLDSLSGRVSVGAEFG